MSETPLRYLPDMAIAPLSVSRTPGAASTLLHDVTFIVVDTETTGGSPEGAALTEIAAVRYRGGERLGSFETLVDPGVPIPPFITALTGISDEMVRTAPPVTSVLPELIEFLGDSVVVGHNVAFDRGFLDAALRSAGLSPLANPMVDTLALARRLVAADTGNCKLSTLAAALRLEHRPSHRALDDVLATGDLLHALIERATGFGVVDLGDLLDFQRVPAAQAARLPLTATVPRRPGVYWFVDAAGTPLALADAADLRAGVRSHLLAAGSSRGAIRLGAVRGIGHLACTGPLEAQVARARLLDVWAPRLGRRRRRRLRSGFVADRPPPSDSDGRAVVEVLRRARHLDVQVDGGERAVFELGVLARTWSADGEPGTALGRIGRCPVPCAEGTVPGRLAAEVTATGRWLAAAVSTGTLRVLETSGVFDWSPVVPGRPC